MAEWENAGNLWIYFVNGEWTVLEAAEYEFLVGDFLSVQMCLSLFFPKQANITLVFL